MGKVEVLSGMINPLEMEYTQVSTRFEPEHGILWTLLDADGVPCYTPGFLREIGDHHSAIQNSGGVVWMDGESHRIRYSVVASLTPGAFNLGGNLELFTKLIRSRDRESLLRYATLCIDVMFSRMNHFDLPLTTISLIQGDALGGGLESALVSDVIIAERSSKMGFPEILFNLFPGMGAYSLVARKIGAAHAEKMILSGNVYTAEELHKLGLVDVVVEDGDGEDAVYEYIRKQSRSSNGFLAVQRARQLVNPVSRKELMDITTIWADAALQLTEKDLKVMDRLIRSQKKHFEQSEHAPVAVNVNAPRTTGAPCRVEVAISL
jgi:DSF synthase